MKNSAVVLIPVMLLSGCLVMSPAPKNFYYSKKDSVEKLVIAQHRQQVEYIYYIHQQMYDSIQVLNPLSNQFLTLKTAALDSVFHLYKDESKQNIQQIAHARSIVVRQFLDNISKLDTLFIGKEQ